MQDVVHAIPGLISCVGVTECEGLLFNGDFSVLCSLYMYIYVAGRLVS